jgi:hypothetical protein
LILVVLDLTPATSVIGTKLPEMGTAMKEDTLVIILPEVWHQTIDKTVSGLAISAIMNLEVDMNVEV